MISNNKTAILFFSRSAKSEVEHKKWSPLQSKRQNAVVATHLINNTLAVLASSGLPVYHYHEEIQIGSTFGERLANAMQDLFSKGFESTITVGNDCLDIRDIQWKDIAEKLRQGVPVLGPSLRKGAYLIGMHKDQFDYEKFSQLCWKTGNLQNDLTEYLVTESSLALYLLESKVDLNSRRDFWRLLKRLELRKLLLTLSIIIELLGLFFQAIHEDKNKLMYRFLYSHLGLRGPPAT